jgi:hypothetical protein
MIIISSIELSTKHKNQVFDLEKKIITEAYTRDSIISKRDSLIKTLEIRLEREKIKRLKLEKAISPRIINPDYFIKLRKYKKIKVTIESVDDLEALRIAGNLNNGFKLANWEVSLIPLRDDWINIKDGITMEVHTAIKEDDFSKEIINAFDELKRIFDDNGILAETWYTRSINPIYEINVLIGFKPVPDIFLSRKQLKIIESLSDSKLKTLNLEAIKELEELRVQYNAINDSVGNLLMKEHPDKYHNRSDFIDRSGDWFTKWHGGSDKIKKDEMYVYRRDYKTKVQLIINEYKRRYPEAKRMTDEMPYMSEGLKNIIDYGAFYWIIRLLKQFSEL